MSHALTIIPSTVLSGFEFLVSRTVTGPFAPIVVDTSVLIKLAKLEALGLKIDALDLLYRANRQIVVTGEVIYEAVQAMPTALDAIIIDDWLKKGVGLGLIELTSEALVPGPDIGDVSIADFVRGLSGNYGDSALNSIELSALSP